MTLMKNLPGRTGGQNAGKFAGGRFHAVAADINSLGYTKRHGRANGCNGKRAADKLATRDSVFLDIHFLKLPSYFLLRDL
jgi:hypothetical protein